MYEKGSDEGLSKTTTGIIFDEGSIFKETLVVCP